MTTDIANAPDASGSATIYTFPPRGRFAVAQQRDLSAPSVDTPLRTGVKIATGAWYHDEAIQAEQRSRS